MDTRHMYTVTENQPYICSKTNTSAVCDSMTTPDINACTRSLPAFFINKTIQQPIP
jgi:hypothetical protein